MYPEFFTLLSTILTFMRCAPCPTIGYLVETFPPPPDSPVVQEILELEQQGLSLHIFSLRLPCRRDHLSMALQIESPVTYIPSMIPQHIKEDEDALMSAHIDLLRYNSEGHDAALEQYLNRPEGKELNELLQAEYLSLELQEWDISHIHIPCENLTTATAELIQYICGVSYSITVDGPDLHYIDAQVLARRIAAAKFIFTMSENSRSYLQEIVMESPPIHVLPKQSPIASTKAMRIGECAPC